MGMSVFGEGGGGGVRTVNVQLEYMSTKGQFTITIIFEHVYEDAGDACKTTFEHGCSAMKSGRRRLR